MNQPTHESSPQEEADSIELAVISLWTTGPDPVRDELFRIAVLRRDADGSWRAFDLFVANPGRDQGVTRRMQREFGVAAKDFDGAPGGEDAWAALDDFVGSAQVLVESREAFEAWARALDAKDEPFAKRWRRSCFYTAS